MRFIGRSNYQDELAIDAMANPAGLRQFFGDRFRLEDVLSYKPDVTVDRATPLVIGGTRFSLLPTRGGETDDALLVHMPDHGRAVRRRHPDAVLRRTVHARGQRRGAAGERSTRCMH